MYEFMDFIYVDGYGTLSHTNICPQEHTVEIAHRLAGGPWPVCMALALPNPHISLCIRLVEHMAPFRGVYGHEWARTGRLDRTLSQHTARASTPRGGI